jgi:hypothetical protein
MAVKEVIYFPFGAQLHAHQAFQAPYKSSLQLLAQLSFSTQVDTRAKSPATKVAGGVGR